MLVDAAVTPTPSPPVPPLPEMTLTMIHDRREPASAPRLRDVRAVIPAELKAPDARRATGVLALVAAQVVVATALAAVVWAKGW